MKLRFLKNSARGIVAILIRNKTKANVEYNSFELNKYIPRVDTIAPMVMAQVPS